MILNKININNSTNISTGIDALQFAKASNLQYFNGCEILTPNWTKGDFYTDAAQLYGGHSQMEYCSIDISDYAGKSVLLNVYSVNVAFCHILDAGGERLKSFTTKGGCQVDLPSGSKTLLLNNDFSTHPEESTLVAIFDDKDFIVKPECLEILVDNYLNGVQTVSFDTEGYINASGVATPASRTGWHYSDEMTVKPGDKLVGFLTVQTGSCAVAFYNRIGTFLSNESLIFTDSAQTLKKISVEVPNDATKVRVCSHFSQGYWLKLISKSNLSDAEIFDFINTVSAVLKIGNIIEIPFVSGAGYIDTNGAIHPTPAWDAIDYTRVTAGQTINLGIVLFNACPTIAYYDANKNFLSDKSVYNTEQSETYQTITTTVPTGVRYMRVCSRNGQNNICELENTVNAIEELVFEIAELKSTLNSTKVDKYGIVNDSPNIQARENHSRLMIGVPLAVQRWGDFIARYIDIKFPHAILSGTCAVFNLTIRELNTHYVTVKIVIDYSTRDGVYLFKYFKIVGDTSLKLLHSLKLYSSEENGYFYPHIVVDSESTLCGVLLEDVILSSNVVSLISEEYVNELTVSQVSDVSGLTLIKDFTEVLSDPWPAESNQKPDKLNYINKDAVLKFKNKVKEIESDSNRTHPVNLLFLGDSLTNFQNAFKSGESVEDYYQDSPLCMYCPNTFTNRIWQFLNEGSLYYDYQIKERTGNVKFLKANVSPGNTTPSTGVTMTGDWYSNVNADGTHNSLGDLGGYPVTGLHEFLFTKDINSQMEFSIPDGSIGFSVVLQKFTGAKVLNNVSYTASTKVQILLNGNLLDEVSLTGSTGNVRFDYEIAIPQSNMKVVIKQNEDNTLLGIWGIESWTTAQSVRPINNGLSSHSMANILGKFSQAFTSANPEVLVIASPTNNDSCETPSSVINVYEQFWDRIKDLNIPILALTTHWGGYNSMEFIESLPMDHNNPALIPTIDPNTHKYTRYGYFPVYERIFINWCLSHNIPLINICQYTYDLSGNDTSPYRLDIAHLNVAGHDLYKSLIDVALSE